MAKFVAIRLIYVCEIMNTYVLDEQKLKKETMKKIYCITIFQFLVDFSFKETESITLN